MGLYNHNHTTVQQMGENRCSYYLIDYNSLALISRPNEYWWVLNAINIPSFPQKAPPTKFQPLNISLKGMGLGNERKQRLQQPIFIYFLLDLWNIIKALNPPTMKGRTGRIILLSFLKMSGKVRMCAPWKITTGASEAGLQFQKVSFLL